MNRPRTRKFLHLPSLLVLPLLALPIRAANGTTMQPKDARAIVAELKKFDKSLALKPRWLVMTKRDLLPDDEAEARAKDIVRRLRFRGPHFLVSAATGRGTKELAQAVMGFLEEQRAREAHAREEPAGDTAA